MEREPEAVQIIGGGLAGCEAAWQVASRGIRAVLYEMRPDVQTPAHQSGALAELVCSNSLGSLLPGRAPGLLKEELRRLGSLVLRCAESAAVPAGRALAVDRDAFSDGIERSISSHPHIEVRREEVAEIPPDRITVVASGPLTSSALAEGIARLFGQQQLYFWDAMAPIVQAESIDMGVAFRASRYEDGESDYINCPMDAAEYRRFVAELVQARQAPLRGYELEDRRYFEACLPIEVLAKRGEQALAYGPLRPIGLTDPRTGKRPHAVVQLRQDNLAGSLYNLVGFQTNLSWDEQRRVFGLIPGLEQAEWVRFGQMHRNTFINSPELLTPCLSWKRDPRLYFAGQIVGTEGYMGSTASGLLAGVNASRVARGLAAVVPPCTTMLGALVRYVTTPQASSFQPMKPNHGLLPPLENQPRRKRERGDAYAVRALEDLQSFIAESGVLGDLIGDGG
ncbi:MAG: methylenetetrahydrofolate--tRNA-(uracil(54)-C(5))-methyltransferase (FADH(2)-oxidizing) TrmFO [Chloroflexi bacterium]|nr:methylenetetrahydrofolate--tRNA-(uracil(54)-C(5))-methyltransferase (FADH(2)-oxidizing) TrmFO [Chloroflexota bacterium]